jgi:DNA topoisomerase-3
VQPGWLAVYGKEAQGDEALLTPVKPGEVVTTAKVDVAALATRPPPRYNEATLLSAMEGAGKTIEDEELREAMREKGLGTPATRAQIIEGLIAERYILREGRELIPTPKAFSLLTLLHGLGIPELFSPELTAEWEFKLAQMEHGSLARKDFMDEIVTMTRRIVAQAKNYESDTIPGDFATLAARCPKCGGEVHEKYRKFQCVQCDFGFWKIMGGRQLSPAEAEVLLTAREVGPLDGFRSRLGRPFSAKLRLTDANEVEFDFGPRADDDSASAPDFSGQEPLGPCPKCGHRVFETPNAYVCERAVGPERSCDFRSGRTILQRVVERAQMTKLLETGKSDLLQFVSARTRRPFSAFLVRGADGKVGFEFAPREGGRAARGAARTPLRVLGRHPRDGQPVELHAGRYGPYVKHGTLNATIADKTQVDSLTLDQAVQLLDERAAREGGARAPRGTPRTAPPRGVRQRAMEPAPATTRSAAKPAAKPIRPRAAAAKTKPVATVTKPAAAKTKPVAAQANPVAAKSKAAAKPATRAKPSAAARAPTVAKPAIPLAKRKPAVARTRATAAKRKAALG